ncbi:MAG: hypothetical protein M3Y39_11505 [Chloroflexota bacterium]|nr:hypothetical protein [Chloroflexota bacterium]
MFRMTNMSTNGAGRERRAGMVLSRVSGIIVPAAFGFWLARQLPLSRGAFLGMVPVGLISGARLQSWWSVVMVPLSAFGGFSLSISIGQGWGGVWKAVRLPVLIALIVGLFSPSAISAAIGTWIGKRVANAQTA